ncbi:MAG: pilus assembly PilX N-terminal domain-containing protein [Candidatus Omnitrophota bacterium]
MLKKQSEKGAVLVISLMIILMLTSITAGFVFLVTVFTRSVGANMVSSKAFWIAEAGLQEAIYKVSTDVAYRNNPVAITNNLGSGSYTVNVTLAGNFYRISSVAQVAGYSTKVEQSMRIQGYPGGLPEAFYYTNYVSGAINLQNVINGTIVGDIAAGSDVHGEEDWTITGTIETPKVIDFPTVDFTGYEGISDYVINGNFTFEEGQVYEGLYYIKGNVTVEADVTINGGIIAENVVNMRGADGVLIEPPSGMPAVIAGGPIDMSNASGAQIKGVGIIYSESGVNFQNAQNCSYKGTYIVDGNMNVKNTESVVLEFNPDILVNPPPFFKGYTGGGGSSVVTLERDWTETSVSS